MILRHMLRKRTRPRAGSPARGPAATTRASDVILMMMAILLVVLAAFKILHG
ncbi:MULTISPECIES: hypothetical protein [Rhizobium]|uniref:Uncharacterized protein n=1 Tax=Rhizobium rhododendri TaxID=2506430 RepID=A0ABY8IQS3_9HYPH|nr:MULTISPECIES: hypothetical protein [Rhizobium]MBO9171005.1 hypothetical protein [Rhizobium sp. L245/93]MBO9135050.1 hypothetical protein [Rhizobium sp. B209b/85]MBO9186906.1 hypothetical protein [Rhizobium sp. E27B/91]QXZ81032.1 hypothetical protein J5274_19185 [Rhizobium sp. L51/94]QXZ98033.1 hypothetical protein J5289_22265 [Rhizobium sp. B230/85]